jgi:uncharacterized protein (DUF924 family)
LTGASAGRNAAAPAPVLAFWRAAGPDRWFAKDAGFDAEVAARFGGLPEAAAAGMLARWEDAAEGALALVIVLDQFPRNMFRGDARTYAFDAAARAVTVGALDRGFDRQVAYVERQFLYLPLMHSERLADQERCLALAEEYRHAEFLKYAEHHCGIVRRFGRFPHRNAILGRASTPEEQAFLADGGFAG